MFTQNKVGTDNVSCNLSAKGENVEILSFGMRRSLDDNSEIIMFPHQQSWGACADPVGVHVSKYDIS